MGRIHQYLSWRLAPRYSRWSSRRMLQLGSWRRDRIHAWDHTRLFTSPPTMAPHSFASYSDTLWFGAIVVQTCATLFLSLEKTMKQPPSVRNVLCPIAPVVLQWDLIVLDDCVPDVFVMGAFRGCRFCMSVCIMYVCRIYILDVCVFDDCVAAVGV